jgi:mono/diheme cytochrome c family protein
MKPKIVTGIALISCMAAGAVLWFASRVSTSPAVAESPVAPALTAESAPGAAAVSRADEIARGKHLVLTSGCHDCHTPFKVGPNGAEPDMSRKLSGHPESLKMPPSPQPSGPWLVAVSATNTAWSGPWGVSFTANLTSDEETGIGSWTKDDFIQTIRTGRHLGRGRPILPPMPVPVYRNFSDEELGAIFSYLKTVPAIKNRVPMPLPPALAPKTKRG